MPFDNFIAKVSNRLRMNGRIDVKLTDADEQILDIKIERIDGYKEGDLAQYAVHVYNRVGERVQVIEEDW